MVLVHAGKGIAEHSCCCLASHGGHISTTGSICPSANAACLPKKSGVQVFCFQRVQRVHIFPPFTSRPNSQALRSKEKKRCQRWCHTQTHQFLSNWFKVSFIFGACKCVSFFENHRLTKRWLLTGLWGRVVPCLVPGVLSSSAVNVGRNFWLYVRYFIFISFPGYCCSSIQLIWLFLAF